MRNGPSRRWLAGVIGVCVSGSLVAASGAEPRSYEGHRLARVTAYSPADVRTIEEAGGTILNCIPAPGALDVVATPEQLARIEQLGLACAIVHENVQELIDRGRAAGPRGWFDAYHPYDDITAYISQLAAAHPELAEVFPVETSLEGRPIWALRIAGAQVNEFSPAVVYFAAVHAREWISTSVPPYLATYLLDHYGVDPAVTDLVDHVEWILSPVHEQHARVPSDHTAH